MDIQSRSFLVVGLKLNVLHLPYFQAFCLHVHTVMEDFTIAQACTCALAFTRLRKRDKVQFHMKLLIYGYVNIEHIGLMFVENMPSFD